MNATLDTSEKWGKKSLHQKENMYQKEKVKLYNTANDGKEKKNWQWWENLDCRNS